VGAASLKRPSGAIFDLVRANPQAKILCTAARQTAPDHDRRLPPRRPAHNVAEPVEMHKFHYDHFLLPQLEHYVSPFRLAAEQLPVQRLRPCPAAMGAAASLPSVIPADHGFGLIHGRRLARPCIAQRLADNLQSGVLLITGPSLISPSRIVRTSTQYREARFIGLGLVCLPEFSSFTPHGV